MLILWKGLQRDRSRGWAHTFLTQMEEVLGTCVDRGIKVVTNAGGLNPAGLADQVRAPGRPARARGVGGPRRGRRPPPPHRRAAGRRAPSRPPRHRRAARRAPEGRWCRPTPTWGPGPSPRPSAGGRRGHLPAGHRRLAGGRPGRLAPRVVATDWDRLAGAVVAGHVIECGPQATGGNYAFFTEVPGSSTPASRSPRWPSRRLVGHHQAPGHRRRGVGRHGHRPAALRDRRPPLPQHRRGGPLRHHRGDRRGRRPGAAVGHPRPARPRRPEGLPQPAGRLAQHHDLRPHRPRHRGEGRPHRALAGRGARAAPSSSPTSTPASSAPTRPTPRPTTRPPPSCGSPSRTPTPTGWAGGSPTRPPSWPWPATPASPDRPAAEGTAYGVYWPALVPAGLVVPTWSTPTGPRSRSPTTATGPWRAGGGRLRRGRLALPRGGPRPRTRCPSPPCRCRRRRPPEPTRAAARSARSSGPGRATRAATPTSGSGPGRRGVDLARRRAHRRPLPGPAPRGRGPRRPAVRLPEPAGPQLRGRRPARRGRGLLDPARPPGQGSGRVPSEPAGRHAGRPTPRVVVLTPRGRTHRRPARPVRTRPRAAPRQEAPMDFTESDEQQMLREAVGSIASKFGHELLRREGPRRRAHRRAVERSGRGRVPRGQRPRGVRRRRGRDHRAGHRAGGAGRRRVPAAGHRGVPGHLRHHHRQVRHRGAEAAVAPALRHRRAQDGLRHHRARRRVQLPQPRD